MNRSVVRYLYPFQVLQQFVLFIAFGTVIGRSTQSCFYRSKLIVIHIGIVANVAEDVIESDYGSILHTIIGWSFRGKVRASADYV